MILIIGKSDLSTALTEVFGDVVVVGRPEYDVSSQQDCDRLVNDYSPTVVINTVGLLEGDPWDLLTVNYVSAAYLTLKFYEKMDYGHIINVSSATVFWPSYPGINDTRLCYNLGKESLSMFGKHFNRKIIDDEKEVVVSTIEPGRFPSKINNQAVSNRSANNVAEYIKFMVDNKIQQVAFTK